MKPARGRPRSPASLPRLRLGTVQEVRRELAKIYAEGKVGARDVGDVSKLANVLSLLARLIVDSTLEERVAEIERRQAGTGEG